MLAAGKSVDRACSFSWVEIISSKGLEAGGGRRRGGSVLSSGRGAYGADNSFLCRESGKPAPAKVMEQAFLQTIPTQAVGMKPEGCGLAGFRLRFFENSETEGGRFVHHIYAGYFARGELLSVNVLGRSREECRKAMELLQTLQKTEEQEHGKLFESGK